MGCSPCPSRSESASASVACVCQDGFQRKNDRDIQKGCVIRTRADRGYDQNGFRKFMLQIVLQIGAGNESEVKLQELMRLQVRMLVLKDSLLLQC